MPQQYEQTDDERACQHENEAGKIRRAPMIEAHNRVVLDQHFRDQETGEDQKISTPKKPPLTYGTCAWERTTATTAIARRASISGR